MKSGILKSVIETRYEAGRKDGFMNNTRKKVTLKDIAEATGFSINTVSRALRGEKNIAPETLQKIQDARLRMGYINNTLASSLRRGYTNTIAVILGDVSNPHFGVMMSEIEARARMYGYTSFLQTTDENEALELSAIQSAMNKSVDGIIICPCQQSDKNIRYLDSLGIPYVLIGRRCETVAADYVICNDELGGYQAAKMLIQNGHERILMLQGSANISSAHERLEGYLRAHREAGLAVDERLIREGSVMGQNNNALYEQIMEEDLHFTGVFAFSDLIAWDFWRFLHNNGYRVPEDYSIVGFDNIQSRLSVPFNLTSISSHKGRMSVEAVDVLVRRMRAQDNLPPAQVVIDTTLAQGETVRKIN